MSNANVPLVIDSFRTQMNLDTEDVKAQMSPDFIIDRISCKRAINSKNPGAKTTEVLISKI